MKKIGILAAGLLILLSSCNKYNERNFPGYEDRSKIVINTATYNYKLTDADYTALKVKYFSPSSPAKSKLPDYLAKTLFKAADKGSTAMITYTFMEDRAAYTDSIKKAKFYTLTDDDYASALGHPGTALSPNAKPETAIPIILKSKVKAENGQYAFVSYNYAEEDVEIKGQYIAQSFDGLAAGSGVKLEIPGWINFDAVGTNARVWECRTFSGNNYAQITSNSKDYVGSNETWLISKEVNLKDAVKPMLSFGVGVGYWRGALLSVMVSENFNGTNAGIKTATWTDISSSFSLPTDGNPAGYDPITPAGNVDLSAYNGKKICIAFRYSGKETGPDTPEQVDPERKTTTYQLDDIKFEEEEMGDIPTVVSTPQHATFAYNGTVWAIESKALTLQPSDYAAIGMSTISTANAPNYLPAALNLYFPYAQSGTVKSVVYKTSTTAVMADEYTFTKGQWTPNNVAVQKSEQYVCLGGSWVYDPTITYAMTKDDHQIMINYILTLDSIKKMVNEQYKNEEFYYGFSSRYNNLSFRISYRNNYLQYDPTMNALAGNNEAMLALMFERSKAGLALFLQKKFPEAQSTYEGVDQFYQVVVLLHSPNDGVTNETFPYVYRFQCMKSGTPASPAEFKFIEYQRQ